MVLCGAGEARGVAAEGQRRQVGLERDRPSLRSLIRCDPAYELVLELLGDFRIEGATLGIEDVLSLALVVPGVCIYDSLKLGRTGVELLLGGEGRVGGLVLQMACDWTALSTAMRDNRRLHKLDLASEADLVQLARSLRTNIGLRELAVLSGIEISEAGWIALAAVLETNTTLRCLYLTSARLSAAAGTAMARALATNTTLRTLQVLDCDLQATDAIAGELTRTRTLQKLGVCVNSDIGGEWGLALASNLTTNTSLTELNLYDAGLDDGAGAALFAALAENRKLQKLRVGMNGLGEASCLAMTRALRGMSALRVLSLDGNQPLGDAGSSMTDVFKAVRASTSLQELDLEKCRLTEAHAAGIALMLKGVQPNQGLRCLNLARNGKLGEQGWRLIAEALASNGALRRLILFQNKLGEQAALALAVALEHNATLQVLDVSRNKEMYKHKTVVTAFLDMLQSNRSLRRLRICNPAFRHAANLKDRLRNISSLCIVEL